MDGRISNRRLAVGLTRREVMKSIAGAAIAGSFASVPTLASASQKSPLKGPVTGSFAELVRFLPDSLLGTSQLDYSDYASKLASYDINGRPTSANEAERRMEALRGMAFSLAGDLAAPEWKSAFGFDLWDIDQFLELHGDDVSLTVLRGRFDSTLLVQAWMAAGYEPLRADGGNYYSAGDDWDFDFNDPVSSLHFGRFDNFVLLDSATIIASATRKGAEEVIRLRAGNSASMANGAAFRAIGSALPSNLVTATVLDGRWLQPTMDSAVIVNNPNVPADTRDDLATRIADQEAGASSMPPIAAVLAGATTTNAIVVGVTFSPESAETAAGVAANRLEIQAPLGTDYAGTPYTDLFAVREVDTIPGQPAFVIDLLPAIGIPTTIARELLLEQSLSLLVWNS